MAMFSTRVSTMAVALLLGVCLGCGGTPATKKEAAHDKHDHHDHPSKGPHGGELIELGQEEYHAELLHDEQAGKVTIHLLDSGAKLPVTIAATEVLINLKAQGAGKQFKLAAAPLSGESAGKCSTFVSNDKQLAELLDVKGAEPQLVVDIAGKQFRGSMAHEH